MSGKKKRQPDNVCWQCIEFSGKLVSPGVMEDESKFEVHEGLCDLCKNKGLLIPVKMIGFFTNEELTLARQEIAKRGLKNSDEPNPKSIEKALIIVEGVLGDDMSFWTRKVWKGVKDDYERGKKIRKYDLEKLMFWFAKDVSMREEVPQEDGGGACGLSVNDTAAGHGLP